MKFFSIPAFFKKNGVIILILIIASFLRLYRIADYMTFLGDEGRDVLVAYNILHGHLTLLGPTSSVGGFFLGPIYYYFMAPFLWLFNYNPVGPAIMVALFGVATVWLVYKISKEFFNENVGLISALLYALSPVVISYSRSSWNPNILPFFSILTIYFIYKAIKKNSFKLLFIVGILLGICLQLHYLALFLGAVIFFYIVTTQYKKVPNLIRSLLAVFSGFLIGWSPFLAFELRHGFPDFRNIFNFLIHSGNTGISGSYLSIVSDVFFRLFGRLVLNFPDVSQISRYSNQVILLWTIFIWIVGIVSVGRLLKTLINNASNKESFQKYLLLFLWFFVGVLLFGFYKKAIYDYYFTFMFALPFILIGSLIYSIHQNFKFWGKSISIILILVIVGLNLWGIPFRYEPNRQLNQMQTIADFVMTKTNAKPYNFALISGGNSDHAYRYFFTVWNHPPVTIQYPGVDPKRNTVTDQLLVVCESPLPCNPIGHSLWEIAGFGRAEIAGHWKVSVVEVYKLVHYKGK